MEIIAHRGIWQSHDAQNSREALRKALISGLGIETDIRDLNGELVISHDMPMAGALPVTDFLDDYIELGATSTLALNIKSDGIALLLKHLLIERRITNYFCFDMSVPDMFSYILNGMPVAARLSEYEPEGVLSNVSPVLWVDGFHDLSIDENAFSRWLAENKKICVVSPELHGRSPNSIWKKLLALPGITSGNVMLCTDYPHKIHEMMS
ncbi:hypothetical protein [Citrobacter sp. FP75]|uniref:hypothetical protein n=1 Tax=Citrobacter sp. FP75 TaxID=1852949 RepID=UPI001BC94A13|nr:hypothetical protein [Citrobacter sp. FP75]